MMNNYTLVSQKPKIFSTFTRLSIEEFNRLYQTIEEKIQEIREKETR
jgi:hypothetical protein